MNFLFNGRNTLPVGFLNYDHTAKTLTVSPIEDSLVGIHTITVVLQDHHTWEPKSRNIKFAIEVKRFDTQSLEAAMREKVLKNQKT